MRREIKRKYNTKPNSTSFKKGHAPLKGAFGKGSKMPELAKTLISASLTGKTGSKARRWLGEKAGYVAKHMWINKYYGKAGVCENKICIYPKRVNAGRTLLLEPKRFEWANVSGKYLRDRKDYIQLCPSCHRKMDMGKMEVVL